MRDRNFQLENEKNVVFLKIAFGTSNLAFLLKIAYTEKLSVWMS